MLCQRYSFGQGCDGMIVRFTRRMNIKMQLCLIEALVRNEYNEFLARGTLELLKSLAPHHNSKKFSSSIISSLLVEDFSSNEQKE